MNSSTGIIAQTRGVVPLIDMLKFAALDFLTISHIFGEILGRSECHKPMRQDLFGESLSTLTDHCGRLGFNVTRDHIYRMILEIGESTPGSLKFSEKGFSVTDGKLDFDRVAHFAEALYGTLLSEVGSILFVAIPRERIQYCMEEWLKDTAIPDTFPTSLDELQSAGRCYSLAEPTACVFHSMRALEPSLNALAIQFGVSFGHDNWQTVIEQIESNVRQLGQQQKSPEKIQDEKFFGAATSRLYFVKNAWRNHVAHARAKYGDSEALKIMDRTVQFVESLCPRLCEPGAQ